MNLICDICQIKFSTKFTLTLDIKKINMVSRMINRIKLNLISNVIIAIWIFLKKTLLINHLNKHHGMSINKEVMEFSNVPGKLKKTKYTFF